MDRFNSETSITLNVLAVTDCFDDGPFMFQVNKLHLHVIVNF